MILLSEPIFVEDDHRFLLRYISFFDVVGNLEIQIGLFHVVVQKQQPAGIYFEIGIGSFEFIEGEVGKLVFDELYPLFNAVEIQGKFLFLIRLLQKLQAGIESLYLHLRQYLVVGLPRMKIEVFIDFLLQSDLVGHYELFLGDVLLG